MSRRFGFSSHLSTDDVVNVYIEDWACPQTCLQVILPVNKLINV